MVSKVNALEKLRKSAAELYNSQDSGSAYDIGGLAKVSSSLMDAKRQGIDSDKVKEALFGSYPEEMRDAKVTSVKNVKTALGKEQKNITETARDYVKSESSTVDGFLSGDKTLANVMNAVYTLNSSITTGRRADTYWQEQVKENSRNPQDINNSFSSRGSNESWAGVVSNTGAVQVR
jgi:hypothetical protein